ncbi:uncharacterized protein ACHE_11803S [Aspergillus chevalieri]|uniref:Uncharacterized protein n=1 Tax=Aspergillus chevalieri TaxID=182096 RepID=A0A7R7VGR6_ASPCH|nr:uncharacterized protein ACHE_11803S [Aspergillus chevalieri]BCR84401.1 hypothetical protein ACHE_11803S [Aspergillus chevalieri]
MDYRTREIAGSPDARKRAPLPMAMASGWDASILGLFCDCEFAVLASEFRVQGRVGLDADAEDRSR